MHDPTGGITRLTRDAHGNVVRLVQPNGRTWQWQHDFFGRVVAEVDPSGVLTRHHLSDRGDLVAESAAGATQTWFKLDGEQRVIERIDSAGRSVLLRWGGIHHLIERIDANGLTTRLRYDRDAKLVEVENQRGEKHHFAYDALGNLTAEHTFDGRFKRYRRDAAGRVVRAESGAGEIADVAYNAAGELVELALDDGTKQSFERDALGNLVRMVWPEGECRFERDAIGRIVREVQRLGAESYTVEVGYLPNGKRATRRTSLGHAIDVERDPDGVPIRTTYDGEHVVLHDNDALGREVARTLPGGGRIESHFDPAGYLVRRSARRSLRSPAVGVGEPDWIGAQDRGLTADAAYRYDPQGRLAEAVDPARGARQFDHDPAGRLLAVQMSDGTQERYAYDPTGNLVHDGGAGVELAYGPGDRLLRRGSTEYGWDDDGRLAEKREHTAEGTKVWQYRWNRRGLLASVSHPDGARVEFSYDPLARRTEKRLLVPGKAGSALQAIKKTRFVWDQHTLVHEIRETASAAGDPVVEERTFVFSEDGFVPEAHREVKRGPEGELRSGWYHYLSDPIGTPERLIQDDGEVAAELRRKTWGETETAPGAETTTPIRFQGQYEDEETGLCHNRYRYYDPETGRFISADPLGLGGGLNAFARGTRPTLDIDALGLASYPLNLINPERPLEGDEAQIKAEVEKTRSQIPPGTGVCHKLDNDFARKDLMNRRTLQIGDGKTPMKTLPGVTDTTWYKHSATELKDGRVVDTDRGIMYKNEQQWLDHTVERGSVGTPQRDDWYDPGSGGGTFGRSKV
jgi:RHS repeat-associated protein